MLYTLVDLSENKIILNKQGRLSIFINFFTRKTQHKRVTKLKTILGSEQVKGEWTIISKNKK